MQKSSQTHKEAHLEINLFLKRVTFPKTPKIYSLFDGSEGAEGEDRTRASNSQGAPQ